MPRNSRILMIPPAMLASIASAQTTYYVRTSGSDSNAGTTPAAAFRTIQRGVNACTTNNCRVVVGPGTYNEIVYIGTGTGAAAASGSASTPNMISGDTSGILTGDAPGEVVIGGGNSRAYGILFQSRSDWQFHRLTIRDQTTYAVYLQSASGIVLNDCTIEVPPYYGVYGYSLGDFTLTDSVFERASTSGHCTYLFAYNTSSADITITGNNLAMTGSLYASKNLDNGIPSWSGPSAYPYGIVAMAYSTTASDIVIQNNIVSDSYLPVYVYTYGNSTSTVRISGNTVTESYYTYYVYGYNNPVCDLTNNIFSNSYYSHYMYAPSYGRIKGLIAHNPRYSFSTYAATTVGVSSGNPLLADPAAGDFSLQAASPAIDTGYADSAPSVDYAGMLRPFDGDNDGVDEYDLGALEHGSGENPAVIMVHWRETDPEED